MTGWQLIETHTGTFLERFADLDVVPCGEFRVVRDGWDTEAHPPRRTICQVE